MDTQGVMTKVETPKVETPQVETPKETPKTEPTTPTTTQKGITTPTPQVEYTDDSIFNTLKVG
jgi:hypothetical protein